jgi:hypothetical protein
MATRRMSKRSAPVDLMLRLPDQGIIFNMAKRKKKLTPAQEAAKEERRKKFMFVFIKGKQVRVRRPETIDGIDIHEFIRRNADPIWLHQHGMYELIDDDAF